MSILFTQAVIELEEALKDFAQTDKETATRTDRLMLGLVMTLAGQLESIEEQSHVASAVASYRKIKGLGSDRER